MKRLSFITVFGLFLAGILFNYPVHPQCSISGKVQTQKEMGEPAYKTCKTEISPAECTSAFFAGNRSVNFQKLTKYPFKFKFSTSCFLKPVLFVERYFQLAIKPVLNKPETVFLCVYRL